MAVTPEHAEAVQRTLVSAWKPANRGHPDLLHLARPVLRQMLVLIAHIENDIPLPQVALSLQGIDC